MKFNLIVCIMKQLNFSCILCVCCSNWIKEHMVNEQKIMFFSEYRECERKQSANGKSYAAKSRSRQQRKRNNNGKMNVHNVNMTKDEHFNAETE